MDAAARDLVRARASHRCESCLLRQADDETTQHGEHMIKRQHGGGDDHANLALACNRCNLHEGPNLTGIDPGRGGLVPLFHPRRDARPDHFELRGARIAGRTPIGRATVHVLAMNAPRRVDLRAGLVARGRYP